MVRDLLNFVLRIVQDRLLILRGKNNTLKMTAEIADIENQQIRQIYHEKQRKQLCLLHTLNNLFQRREFEQQELDAICENLDGRRWLNQHRSWIGMGNYDANILLVALQNRGLVGRWFDRRMQTTRIDHDRIIAYIFNIPTTPIAILPFYKGRHWFPIVRIDNVYYNLDSKLPNPVQIDDFPAFIERNLTDQNELLLVVNPENEEKCIRLAT